MPLGRGEHLRRDGGAVLAIEEGCGLATPAEDPGSNEAQHVQDTAHAEPGSGRAAAHGLARLHGESGTEAGGGRGLVESERTFRKPDEWDRGDGVAER